MIVGMAAGSIDVDVPFYSLMFLPQHSYDNRSGHGRISPRGRAF
jgi:hypothetical protein